jgi:fluoride exporter
MPSDFANLSEVRSADVFDGFETTAFDTSGLEMSSFQSSPPDPRYLERPGNAGVPRESTTSAAPGPDIPIERTPEPTSTPYKRSSGVRHKRSSASTQRFSRLLTQIYTYSYLIFFSIWGVLARIGLQKLTFYPGAPATMGVLWANFAGSFIMGFFSEDQYLFRSKDDIAAFRAEKSRLSSNSSNPHSLEEFRRTQQATEAKAAHGRFKKTIPLYIGITTGFCGSLTSFSSFMRDVFLALSNDLPSPPASSTFPRNGGYSLAAVLAVIILTLALSLSALVLGGHFAVFLAHYRLLPSLQTRFFRSILDKIMVPLAVLAWLATLILCLAPPDAPDAATPYAKASWRRESWRADALFALVFAPVGCLLRFWLALRLNGLRASFPLGTFAANVFGTAVLAACFDLERVPVMSAAGRVGGGNLGCAVLQGIQDGFCGALTTVSTFVAELATLRRSHSYVYGIGSVGMGLVVVVALMGSVRWGIGWKDPVCVA